MRIASICVLCVFGFAVSAQDPADHRMHLACVAAPTHLGHCFSGSYADHVGDLLQGRENPISVTLAASEIRTDPDIHLRGKAEIHTASMVLVADEADYSRTTGEIEARGNVHVTLTPPR